MDQTTGAPPIHSADMGDPSGHSTVTTGRINRPKSSTEAEYRPLPEQVARSQVAPWTYTVMSARGADPMPMLPATSGR